MWEGWVENTKYQHIGFRKYIFPRALEKYWSTIVQLAWWGMFFCCFLLPTLLSAQSSGTHRLSFLFLTSPDCSIHSSGSSLVTPKYVAAIKRNWTPTYTASFCLVAPYSWLCSGQVSITAIQTARIAVMQARMWPLNILSWCLGFS